MGASPKPPPPQKEGDVTTPTQSLHFGIMTFVTFCDLVMLYQRRDTDR